MKNLIMKTLKFQHCLKSALGFFFFFCLGKVILYINSNISISYISRKLLYFTLSQSNDKAAIGFNIHGVGHLMGASHFILVTSLLSDTFTLVIIK